MQSRSMFLPRSASGRIERPATLTAVVFRSRERPQDGQPKCTRCHTFSPRLRSSPSVGNRACMESVLCSGPALLCTLSVRRRSCHGEVIYTRSSTWVSALALGVCAVSDSSLLLLDFEKLHRAAHSPPLRACKGTWSPSLRVPGRRGPVEMLSTQP